MKLRLIFIFFILGAFISSCAYYNTFYNTKKFYKEATKEREKRKGDKPSTAELNKYDQTIEKASKILEIYPKSKYVDDAVFILGECFYYKEDYVKAHRKFEELITYFPKSEYFYQAKLWLAKTNIKMEEYLSARFTLTEILETPKIKRDIRDESRYLLGEIQFEQAFYEEAAKEFKKVAETTKNKAIRAKAFYQLGLSQINTEDYFNAVQSFKMALKYSPDKQFAFDAELNLGKALKLSGDFKNASNVCLSLLEDESFKTNQGLVKLEIADCMYREGKALHDTLESANLPYLGKIEEALDEYKKITSEHRRTDVAAQAYYQMAKIYEEDFRDFASAKEYYDKVKLEYNRSEYVPESLEKAKNIGDLVRLKNLVKKSQGEQLGENNGNGHTMTELELLLLEHGVDPELRFMKKQRRLAKLTQATQTDQ
ncbi:MAG: tol-pal system YbgF family protein, partial [bacterium]